jgi:hypothetical protein
MLPHICTNAAYRITPLVPTAIDCRVCGQVTEVESRLVDRDLRTYCPVCEAFHLCEAIEADMDGDLRIRRRRLVLVGETEH